MDDYPNQLATQEGANRAGRDLSRQIRPTLEVGSRVLIDEALGNGTVIAWVDRDTIDGSVDAQEDWVIVQLDEGLWAWKGYSYRVEGQQAVAFNRVIVVSVSNLTCID